MMPESDPTTEELKELTENALDSADPASPYYSADSVVHIKNGEIRVTDRDYLTKNPKQSHGVKRCEQNALDAAGLEWEFKTDRRFRDDTNHSIVIVTGVATNAEPVTDEPDVATDGGVVQDDADEHTRTTAYEKGDEYGRITHAGRGPENRQRRLVGNIREGQVMVDMEAYQYDSDETTYEGYTGNTWTIANVSDDGRHLTLRKRDGDDEGRERRLTVAAFAREHLHSDHAPGRWMFLKDSRLANTWSTHIRQERIGKVCENCGVNTDMGLSREDHFTTTVSGDEYNATLRRCVGCGMVGIHARRDVGHSVRQFTTGILAGPSAPWRTED